MSVLEDFQTLQINGVDRRATDMIQINPSMGDLSVSSLYELMTERPNIQPTDKQTDMMVSRKVTLPIAQVGIYKNKQERKKTRFRPRKTPRKR